MNLQNPSTNLAYNRLALLFTNTASGQPVCGLEVLLTAHLPNNITIPFGKLVSDHTGYACFDLTHAESSLHSLIDQHLRLHGSGPFDDTQKPTSGTDVPRIAAATVPPASAPGNFSIIANLRTLPEQKIDILKHGFGLVRDALLADIRLNNSELASAQKGNGLVSIQRPSLTDWVISPSSFSINPAFFIGQDQCENLYPANFATQEFRFHQILRDGSKNNLDHKNPVMHGWSLEYQSTWEPLGHTLGKLVYTLPLAPGEITNISIVDWSRKSVDSRFDDLSVAEQLMHNTHRDRSISETVEAALEEWQRGGSVMGGVGGSLGYGAGAMSMGASAAIGGGYSTSSGDRNVTASTVQQLSDGFSQASSAFRELRSTVVVQSAQQEHAEAKTRVVANYNHAHSLTILYYEVLHHYKVTTEFLRTRRCLLVNYSGRMVDFNDDKSVEKFQTILKKVLLDKTLLPGFELISKLLFYKGTMVAAQLPSDYKFNMFQIRIKTGDDGTDSDVSTALYLKNNTQVDLFFNESGDSDKRILDRSGYNDFEQGDDDSYLLTPKTPIRWGDIKELIIKLDGGGNWRLAHVTLTGIAAEGDFVLYDAARSDLLSNSSLSLTTKAAPDSIVQTPDDKLSEAEKLKIFKLKKHLLADSLHYNRAIWLLEDPNERAIRFAATQFGGKALLDLIDNRPIDVLGDFVAFPSNDELLPIPLFESGKSEKLMTLPTRGVFAEAKLGHCSASEIIDNTRFWDWQTSPIPEKAPPIAPASTDSRNDDKNLTPAQMPSAIVNIVSPSPAPDPTAMAGALGLLGKSDIFRNMSMSKEVSDLLGKLASNSISMAEAGKKARDISGGGSTGTGGGSDSSGGGGSSGGGNGSIGKPGSNAGGPQQLMDWSNAIKNSGLSAEQKAKLTEALVDNLSNGNTTNNSLYNFHVTPAVPFIKQPSSDTCWAATATMLRSWKEGKALSITEVMDKAGPSYRALFDAGQGLESEQMPVFFENLGMGYAAPANYTIDFYANLLKTYGPLWLTLDDDQAPNAIAPHAFILVGIKGDGSADKTQFILMDPAAAGEAEYPFTEFLQKFEEMASQADPNKPLFLQIAYNLKSQSVGAPKPYDRNAAVIYAQTYFNRTCSDNYLFSQTDAFYFADPAAAAVPNENDCTHFVSCCIGQPPKDNMNQISGGGLFLDPAGFFKGKTPEPYGMTIPNVLLRYLKLTNKIKFLNDQGGLQDDLFYHQTSNQANVNVPFPDLQGDIIFYTNDNQFIKPAQAIDFHHAAVIVGIDNATQSKQISCHTSNRFNKPADNVAYSYFVYARIIK
ncbi:papain-like cysteine protease family protein [Undibacterium sp. TS12]|uniref:papain-like cysteine protease family protein n=1 Tax=Undibacterium sp. TS12 TaxID=2908202 RepID=UPI001F4C6283|nr:papain-like cysteine protease family protein [Undibacterium sp. TS12]MCH8622179.1 amidase domain-containing protein [Undibacterium sp. TS12]